MQWLSILGDDRLMKDNILIFITYNCIFFNKFHLALGFFFIRKEETNSFSRTFTVIWSISFKFPQKNSFHIPKPIRKCPFFSAVVPLLLCSVFTYIVDLQVRSFDLFVATFQCSLLTKRKWFPSKSSLEISIRNIKSRSFLNFLFKGYLRYKTIFCH